VKYVTNALDQNSKWEKWALAEEPSGDPDILSLPDYLRYRFQRQEEVSRV